MSPNRTPIQKWLDRWHSTILSYAGILLVFLEFFLDHSQFPAAYIAAAGMWGYKLVKGKGSE